MKIDCLSEKYEGGGPATISTGDGDSGGVSYGTYQLASKTGSVANFVKWLCHRGDKGSSFGAMLSRHEPGSLEFSSQWLWIAENEPEFGEMQTEFVMPTYFGTACDTAREMGIDTDSMPDALKAVLFSNAIQHGPVTAGELLAESYDDDPAMWIRNIYDTKISDPDWSSGAPTLRPGLFARWENEKQDAVRLLRGEEL